MSDYRTEIYQNYVSTFEIVDTHRNPAALSSSFAYYESKYLPLLKDLRCSGKVLELGCGPGIFLRFLRERGFNHVQGIDISPEQIAIAQSHNLDAQVSDVFEYLGSAKSNFDALVAIDFFEHFTKSELIRLTQGIFDALKEGGYLLIQTPNGQGLFSQQIIYGDLTHSTILNSGSLLQLLRQIGFEEISFHETGPAPISFAGRVRSIGWKVVKFGLNIVRRIECGKKQDIWTENIICVCRKPLLLKPSASR